MRTTHRWFSRCVLAAFASSQIASGLVRREFVRHLCHFRHMMRIQGVMLVDSNDSLVVMSLFTRSHCSRKPCQVSGLGNTFHSTTIVEMTSLLLKESNAKSGEES